MRQTDVRRPAYTGHGVGKAGSAGPHCCGEPLAAGLADWREAGHGFVTVPSKITTFRMPMRSGPWLQPGAA
eukprot:s1594_g6.t1